MLSGLLGRKVGMTQVFGPNGTAIPVTVIEAGPCFVTQIKTTAHDGYEAVQIGFEQQQVKKATRPELGHLGHSLPLLKGQRKRLRLQRDRRLSRRPGHVSRNAHGRLAAMGGCIFDVQRIGGQPHRRRGA